MITDIDLRKKIAAIIRATVTGAQVYHYEVGVFGTGDAWSALLKPPTDNPQKRVHAWTVGREISLLENKGVGGMGGGRREWTWGYRLTGYHFFSDEGDSNNSEDALSTELLALQHAFTQRPVLGLNAQTDGVLKHDELQIQRIQKIPHDSETIHKVSAVLRVRLYETLAPLPPS